jgi:hypothetical protein
MDSLVAFACISMLLLSRSFRGVKPVRFKPAPEEKVTLLREQYHPAEETLVPEAKPDDSKPDDPKPDDPKPDDPKPDAKPEEEQREEQEVEQGEEEEQEEKEEEEEGGEAPRGKLGVFASSMPSFFDMIGLVTRPRSPGEEPFAETEDLPWETAKKTGDGDEVPEGSISPFLFVRD